MRANWRRIDTVIGKRGQIPQYRWVCTGCDKNCNELLPTTATPNMNCNGGFDGIKGKKTQKPVYST